MVKLKGRILDARFKQKRCRKLVHIEQISKIDIQKKNWVKKLSLPTLPVRLLEI